MIGYIDRQELEEKGEVWRHSGRWWEADFPLHAMPPEPPSEPDQPDRKAEVARLRAEMAAKHPDRGGTNAEFIDAHRRYILARGRS